MQSWSPLPEFPFEFADRIDTAQNQNSDDSGSARANERFRVLGVPVDAVQIPGVIGQISRWIDERRSTRYVAVTGMHGITESLRDPHFRVILKAADLVVPDGMPLVWIGRLRGRQIKRRVYGPELMETFCRDTGPRYRHFFYGGAAGVPEDLAQVMQERHGIQVAGLTPHLSDRLRARKIVNSSI